MHSTDDRAKGLEAQIESLKEQIANFGQAQEQAKREIEAVRASETRFRRLLDESTDPIFAIDEDGKYEHVNLAFANGVHRPSEEIIGHRIWDVFSQEEGDRRFAAVRAVLASGQTRNIEVKVEAGGEVRWFLTSVKLLSAYPGPRRVVLCISKDITERKQAEDEVRASEERFRAIADYTYDWENWIGPDGKLIWLNSAVERVTGYSIEECLAMADFPLPLADDSERDRLARLFGEAVAGESADNLEFRLKHKDGGVRWIAVSYQPIFDSKGNHLGHRSSLRDISVRKRAEESQRETEARFRHIFDQSPLGSAVVSRVGRFLSVNPALCRILGYSAEELCSLAYEQVTHAEHRDDDYEGAKLLFQGKLDRYVTDKRYLRKDGSEVWCHLVLTLVRDDQDRPLYFLPLVEDISEKKRHETVRLRLEEQLRQAQKMESIGRLAGGIAHDFNNLLTGIIGNTSLALLELKAGDPLSAALKDIDQAANSAAGLTRQLLSFSRKQVIDPRIVDINSLIRRIQSMLLRILSEDVRLETSLASDLGRVKTDPGQLEQTVINLAVNARDAMPKGGTLILSTSNVSLDADFCRDYPGQVAGQYVLLVVTDTGCGMSNEVKAHVFEPFFTTKAKDKGTGLGLAMAYGAVTQAGGIIDLESSPGRGSSFRIYLPRVDAAPDVIAFDSPLKDLPGGGETILLVEDEPIVKEFARKLLAKLGYHVLDYLNAGEALLAARNYAGEIHLLLTDVIMPGMNGRDMADEIRRCRPHMRVLFSSGYTEDVIAPHGVLEPGIHFIGKPYTPQLLAIKVREVIEPKD